MQIYSGSRQDLPVGLWQRLLRYRYQVFVRHLGWELAGNLPGQEVDQFDRADTLYVVAVRQDNGSVVGCARLLPTLKPYLLSEVFPQLLGGLQPPARGDIWELSRFAAMDPAVTDSPQGQVSSPYALALVKAAQRCAARRGATELITVSPVAIGRLLRVNGIDACRGGPVCQVGSEALCAYRIKTTLTARVTEVRELAQ
ncbi:MAG: GNAT family N-acetyltransferase [Halomonadaceae bacterium]|nr:MAG: GNAT family N-acetyltransferase [Halomonadaceae bacterium]